MKKLSARTRTAIWTALSLAAAIAGLLILSTLDNADGSPWLESTVVGQALALLAVVAAGILPSLLQQQKSIEETKRVTHIVRDEVQNSHDINFRDNVDSNHGEVVDLFRQLDAKFERRFDGMASDIRGVRKDIGRNTDQTDGLRTELREHRRSVNSKIDEIEQTVADAIKGAVTGVIEVVAPGAVDSAATEEDSHD
jgi:hypothetical protein